MFICNTNSIKFEDPSLRKQETQRTRDFSKATWCQHMAGNSTQSDVRQVKCKHQSSKDGVTLGEALFKQKWLWRDSSDTGTEFCQRQMDSQVQGFGCLNLKPEIEGS